MNAWADQRRTAELRMKLETLGDELEKWEAASAAKGSLEKHHSQVRALSVSLRNAASLVEQRIGQRAAVPGWIVDDAREIEDMVLELHQVWDWFRSKLALRYVSWFTRHLAVADDLAWHCYLPAQQATGNVEAKAPPLTYFTAAPPATLPRSSAYLAAALPGTELSHEELSAALDDLPIPVIGLPWYQLAHLPDATIIAHEVGHDVEFGLGLTDRVEAVIQAALDRHVDADRHAAWQAWRHELFADVYGTLAAGPAFVQTLMDFLARAPAAIAAEWRGENAWGEHPTATLRVVATAQVLRACDHDGDELEAEWRAVYPSHGMAAFEPDAVHIAGALLTDPWPELGDRRLTEVLTFTPAQQEATVAAAGDALDGAQLATADVRCIVAAARRAYEDRREDYVDSPNDPPERILAGVEAARKAGTRMRGGEDEEIDRGVFDAEDAAAGERLFARLARRAQERTQTEGGVHV